MFSLKKIAQNMTVLILYLLDCYITHLASSADPDQTFVTEHCDLDLHCLLTVLTGKLGKGS